MCADEPDIYEADGELDDGDETVTVALDVEHVALVAYCVDGVEVLLDVGEGVPLAVFHHAHPYLQGYQRVGMLLGELLDGLFGEYSHIFIVSVAKVQIIFDITKYFSIK